jgi:hypothetical protein
VATVLLTWELGGGLGHLVNLLPLARGLCQHGHRVYAAMQDLLRADAVFCGLDISLLQAPGNSRSPAVPVEPQRTFAHILYNRGFGDPRELAALASAWRNLYGRNPCSGER